MASLQVSSPSSGKGKQEVHPNKKGWTSCQSELLRVDPGPLGVADKSPWLYSGRNPDGEGFKEVLLSPCVDSSLRAGSSYSASDTAEFSLGNKNPSVLDVFPHVFISVLRAMWKCINILAVLQVRKLRLGDSVFNKHTYYVCAGQFLMTSQ